MLTNHQLLDGVLDFGYGSNSIYQKTTLDSGATLVGSDNYGVPLLALMPLAVCRLSTSTRYFPFTPPRSFAPLPAPVPYRCCWVLSPVTVPSATKPSQTPTDPPSSGPSDIPLHRVNAETRSRPSVIRQDKMKANSENE